MSAWELASVIMHIKSIGGQACTPVGQTKSTMTGNDKQTLCTQSSWRWPAAAQLLIASIYITAPPYNAVHSPHYTAHIGGKQKAHSRDCKPTPRMRQQSAYTATSSGNHCSTFSVKVEFSVADWRHKIPGSIFRLSHNLINCFQNCHVMLWNS